MLCNEVDFGLYVNAEAHSNAPRSVLRENSLITSGEVLDCVLPDNCSDKALLEYPGFDVVWARQCDNTDWYPNFE